MKTNAIEVKAENKHIDLKIYGSISGFVWEKEDQKLENGCRNVKELESILNKNKDANTIDVFINSTGGSVFEGLAIYNILKRHKAYKRVFIDGFACSIASVIAMCGNQVIMNKSSLMMIHNAWTVAMGNSKELRKVADDLEIINETIINAYKSKISIEDKELQDLMDNETYLSADKCLEYGFCTKIEDDKEETKNSVEQSLDENIQLYSNKLKQLETIKNSIKALADNQSEDISVENSEETNNGEPIEETELTEENLINANVKIVQAEIQGTKDNALKRFFNLERGE